MNKNVLQLSGKGRILKPWVQPLATAANAGENEANGMIIRASSYYNHDVYTPPWYAFDGNSNTDWMDDNTYIGWLSVLFPRKLLSVKSVSLMVNSQYQSGRAAQTAIYTDLTRAKQIGLTQTFPNAQWQWLTYTPDKPIITNSLLMDIQSCYGGAYSGLGMVNIIADEVV